MSETWGPSWLGATFSSASPWSFSIIDERFRLVVGDLESTGSVADIAHAHLKKGIFWAAVSLKSPGGLDFELRGISNLKARQLCDAIDVISKTTRRREYVATLMARFDSAVSSLLAWQVETERACQHELLRRGWLGSEFRSSVVASKPHDFKELLAAAEVRQHLSKQEPRVQQAVADWELSFDTIADARNNQHRLRELTESRDFFNTVEKSALTPEQADAVICFEDRVLLVASAGSGKTSTMVAKAGYALKKGYFLPDQILLLAFNSDAARELADRVAGRLEALGLPHRGIAAKTFHALGLEIAGEATGKKPSVAPWVESGRDLTILLELVEDLKNSDLAFRTTWDMFRIVFGQDLPKLGAEADDPESWDRDSGRNGFRTLNGEVVRSRGEAVIANWLFYNGVAYVYEGSYEHDLADSQHRQYRPDFYFPVAKAYLEHWAVNDRGEPPPNFLNYKEGMDWKKGIHRKYGTRLLETTTAGLWSGKAFEYLEAELTQLGLVLNPDPDRPVLGRQPIENPRLARTIRAFLTHAKGNRLSMTDLRARLTSGAAGDFRFRHEMFLRIVHKIWLRWEARLRQEQVIDFEDMLNLAVDSIEGETWESPYVLVMVDEFQDVSLARARMVAGLVAKPGRLLFAVGDDWQSINRFAGADLSAMTDFGRHFGKAMTLKLEHTFRCPQSLCDISSRFIQKNPTQLRKSVRSLATDVSEPIRILRVAGEQEIRSAIASRLAEIAAQGSDNQKTTVFILGRYHKDEAYVPQKFDARRLQVQFLSIHASKGLEADHVLLPRVTSETMGFPSGVEDDPVLRLAIPADDGFEFGEERRLFYVAMTRARRSVTIVTIAKKESPFLTELIRDFKLKPRRADGSEEEGEICPSCGEGFLIPRSGRYGSFLGCTAFPKCKHTRKLDGSGFRGGGAATRGSARK